MKKGFTLVELLASIVIISLIMLIGVQGYRGISKKVKEQQYKNKIAYIETQAAIYANETGYLNTTVDNLIKLGYITPDNKNGEFINPVNNKKLNNLVVTISRDGDNYYGHITTTTVEDGTDLDMTNTNLTITEKVEHGVFSGDWTNGDVTLTAVVANYTSPIAKITWYNNGLEKIYESTSDLSYNIKTDQILNTTYRAVVEFEDGTSYEATKKVKIDKQNPKIYENELKIEKENEWTNISKTVTAIATDQNGCGLKEIRFLDEGGSTLGRCNSGEVCQVSFDENAKGYVIAYDRLMNESNSIPFTVTKIDKIPPTCDLSITGVKKNTDWFTSDVNISPIVNDNESGVRTLEYTANSLIKERENGTRYINQNTSSSGTNVEIKVIDMAGNSTTCSQNVKIDKEAPNCSFSISGEKDASGYYTSDVYVQLNSSDKNCPNCSGVANSLITMGYNASELEPDGRIKITEDTPDGQSRTIYGQVTDNAGNISTCNSEAFIVKKPKPPVITSITAYKCGKNSTSVNINNGTYTPTDPNSPFDNWSNESICIRFEAQAGSGSISRYEIIRSDGNIVSVPPNNIIKLDITTIVNGYKVYNTYGEYDELPKIQRFQIDQDDPTCTIYGKRKELEWTNIRPNDPDSEKPSPLNLIKYGCSDLGSGCYSGHGLCGSGRGDLCNYSLSAIGPVEIKTEKVKYAIRDKAGNEVQCNETLDIYFDDKPPTVECVGIKDNIKDPWKSRPMSKWDSNCGTNKMIICKTTDHGSGLKSRGYIGWGGSINEGGSGKGGIDNTEFNGVSEYYNSLCTDSHPSYWQVRDLCDNANNCEKWIKEQQISFE